jgi:hypothetical protein
LAGWWQRERLLSKTRSPRLIAVSVAIASPVVDFMLENYSKSLSPEELSWQTWFIQSAEFP